MWFGTRINSICMMCIEGCIETFSFPIENVYKEKRCVGILGDAVFIAMGTAIEALHNHQRNPGTESATCLLLVLVGQTLEQVQDNTVVLPFPLLSLL